MNRKNGDAVSALGNIVGHKPRTYREITSILESQGYSASEIQRAWDWAHLYAKQVGDDAYVSIFG